MNNKDMLRLVLKQFSIDYNCSPDDFYKDGVIFTEAVQNKGRRPFLRSTPQCEMITMGKSVIVMASSNIMPFVKHNLEGKSRYDILNSSLVYGVNPLYLPNLDNLKAFEINSSFKFEFVEKDNIYELYEFNNFPNALQYDEKSLHPEALAIVAKDGEKIIGIASASEDCETMWQISVDVLSEYRCNKIAEIAVNMLTHEVLNRGKIPYYTTDCGNLISQRVAVATGYVPMFSYCYRTRINKNSISKFLLRFV